MAECGRDKSNASLTNKFCELCGQFENLMLCSRCKCTWYCSKEHQRNHWKDHKKLCSSPNQKPQTIQQTNGSSAHELNINKLSTSEPSRTPVNNHLMNINEQKEHVNSDMDSFDVSGMKSRIDVYKSSDSQVYEQEGSSELAILDTDSFALQPFARPVTPLSTVGESRSNNMPPIDTNVHSGGISREQYERNRAVAELIVSDLNQYGICVVDNFLGQIPCSDILQEVKGLQKKGFFKDGQLVKSRTPGHEKNIRGDKITWVDAANPHTPQISDLISNMDTVLSCCAGRLGSYTINGRTKVCVDSV